MKLVDANPAQLLTGEKRVGELLRIYGSFIEIAEEKPRKDYQWILSEMRSHVQGLTRWPVFRECAQHLEQSLSKKALGKIGRLVDGKYL